jgi:hypothetical protein
MGTTIQKVGIDMARGKKTKKLQPRMNQWPTTLKHETIDTTDQLVESAALVVLASKPPSKRFRRR